MLRNRSVHATCEIIDAVTGEKFFSTSDHSLTVKEERQDRKKYWDVTNDVKLQGIISDLGAFKKRLFLYAKHMGSCLPLLFVSF